MGGGCGSQGHGGGGLRAFATPAVVISPLPSKYLVGAAPENAEIQRSKSHTTINVY